MKQSINRIQKMVLGTALGVLVLLLSHSADAQLVTNVGDTFYIKNNTTVFVNGGFNNKDNGSKKPYIYNDGILRVDSNWDAAADMIYLGSDTFMAYGIGPQRVAGLSYYNLMITNGGTKTMSRKSRIRNQLIVSNGTLESGTDTIHMDSVATLIEDSNNNVVGNIDMWKYLAKNTSYNFGSLGFDITTGAKVPGLTHICRVTGSGAVMHGGHGASSIARFFDITPANDKKLAAKVKFHYYGTELNGLGRPDLALWSSEDKGVTWKYAGYTTRNPGTNDLEKLGVDSFSRWTLAGISSPLPVTLMDFTVTAMKLDAKLFWQTASEQNNDHFEIERSLDANEWIKVGTEQGAGNSNSILTYTFMDYNAGLLNAPEVYYRLKQVDYNGKFTYSPIRKVVFTAEGSTENLKVWYNSSEGNAYINITANTSRPAVLTCIDMQGKLISQENVYIKEGTNMYSLNLSQLSKGVYSISLSDNTGVMAKKILKY